MLNLIEAIIITQIVLETLPVSSSGHLLIVQKCMTKFFPSTVTTAPSQLFCEILNIPTLFVLTLFFRQELLTLARRKLSFLRVLFKKNRGTSYHHHVRWFTIITKICFLALAANIITFIIYFFLATPHTSCPPPTPSGLALAGALTISMCLLLSSYFQTSRKYQSLTLGKACVIGFVQAMSIIPGISRLGSTFVAARWLNIAPRRAFEFSFLLHAMLSIGLLIKTCVGNPAGLTDVLAIVTPKGMLLLQMGSVLLSWWCLHLSYSLAMLHRWWMIGVYYLFPILLTLLVFSYSS